MHDKKPSDFVDSFTDERLTIIAQALKEQCFKTDDDLQSDYDSGYSVGCTRFDRQKNKLKRMALEYDWLNISDGSNRLVMNINGAPFRFTRDDYSSPKKRSSTAVSETEAIQIEKFSASHQGSFNWGDDGSGESKEDVVKWRFFIDVIDALDDGERDYEISFVGFNEVDQVKCVWNLSDNSSTGISSADEELPDKVTTEAAKTTLPVTEVRKHSDE